MVSRILELDIVIISIDLLTRIDMTTHAIVNTSLKSQ